MVDHSQLLGEGVAAEIVLIRRSRELVTFLQSGAHPYAHLREVRAGGLLGGETIVFDLDIAVGQLPAADVRDIERVSVTFLEEDDEWPEVLALREDFPAVLHTNLRFFETPKSLCLYEARFADSRSAWTTISIVERIREWLRDTAAGELHRSDQPVEQLFLVTPNRIILPSHLERQLDADPRTLTLQYFDRRPWGQILLCREGGQPAYPPGYPNYLLLSLVSPVLTQAAIRREPQSLGDLEQIYASVGAHFLGELRSQVAALEAVVPNLSAVPVILVTFPRSRQEHSEIERIERWAFLCDGTLGELGAILGVWQVQNGVPGHLLAAGIDLVEAHRTKITILNPSYALSPEMAARFSGTEDEPVKTTAVGMGALGSQVTALLVRTGFGRWTLIDGDVLLPHNVVRHLANGSGVGFQKVEVVRAYLETLFDTKVVDATIFGDVMREGAHAKSVKSALQSSDLVLDFSASAAVQRHIARSAAETARCVCCFLNPSGTALVVLAEDSVRRDRLDVLEMQYYRALMRKPELLGHLPADLGSVRYARSCGDQTSLMPTDNIAIFAGLASKNIRNIVRTAGASVSIFSMAKTGTVSHVTIDVSPTHRVPIGAWTIVFDTATLAKMLELRNAKHPTETGGVIVGVWDLDAGLIYIVDALSAPEDSEETQQSFIRGTCGLAGSLAEVATRTANVVQYVGEWHSHPDGFAANPSVDDLILYGWLHQRAHEMGLAPVMAILAENEVRWICGGDTARISFQAIYGEEEVSDR